jgi:DHA2 family multidrug resistance protein
MSHLHRGDVFFDRYFTALQQSAVHTGISAADAGRHALAQLQLMVDAQASVLAFVSAFFVLGVIVAILVPLPFLMKRPSPEEAAAAQGLH